MIDTGVLDAIFFWIGLFVGSVLFVSLFFLAVYFIVQKLNEQKPNLPTQKIKNPHINRFPFEDADDEK